MSVSVSEWESGSESVSGVGVTVVGDTIVRAAGDAVSALLSDLT